MTRLILDGAPIDSRRASERLGYELTRRHTALVVWTEQSGVIQDALEPAATVLARATGARTPLTLSAGTSTLGPLAVDTPSAARLRETLRVFPDEAENAPRAVRLHRVERQAAYAGCGSR
ncbi:hypothetical protein SAMN06265360_12262 [Haloechinothrix alba]|uniref:CdaR GGDEF-like domain-containing protein n=1 Tax=Haloechinothrix alba TaxID=664784 RepID=A0A238ZLR3_9PSEU|nr:hypothetical protein [Haloechinothrix alba]SNR84386.1 hypothetical protein SAMN06265360_12262 [Haloechinothrix alba]